MHPDLEALTKLLEEASELLRMFEQEAWANWLSLDAARIRNSDFYGVEHLLSAFGGMGSLNDVVFVDKLKVGQVIHMPVAENERFASLRSRIYDLAAKLRREEGL